MRRSDREITDISEILSIVDRCKVIHLAMIDGNRPYLVPLNFGYSYTEGTFTFYCHSAPEGRKLKVLQNNPVVFFEMDTDHALVSHELACSHSYRYSSIMGDGTARFLDGDEKVHALEAIMLHQTGRSFSIPPERVSGVSVFAIEVSSLSAKSKK